MKELLNGIQYTMITGNILHKKSAQDAPWQNVLLLHRGSFKAIATVDLSYYPESQFFPSSYPTGRTHRIAQISVSETLSQVYNVYVRGQCTM